MKNVTIVNFEPTRINVIKCTKGLEEGRYGFLIDLIY